MSTFAELMNKKISQGSIKKANHNNFADYMNEAIASNTFQRENTDIASAPSSCNATIPTFDVEQRDESVRNHYAHTQILQPNEIKGYQSDAHINTEYYRTPVDQSVVDADPTDYDQIKKNYDSAKLRLSQLQVQGAHGTRTVFQNTPAYKQQLATAQSNYDIAEKAYNDATKKHNNAAMAKTINADSGTIKQIEATVQGNSDFSATADNYIAGHKTMFDANSRLQQQDIAAARTDTAIAVTPDTQYRASDYFTDSEKRTYAYLLAKNPTEAKKYYNAMLRTLDYRKSVDTDTSIQNASDKSTIAGRVYNFYGSLEKPLGAAYSIGKGINDTINGKSEPMDSNSSFFAGNHMAETSQNSLVNKADTSFGKWAVGAGLGVMNSIPVIAASVASPAVGAAIVSSQSAGDAAYSVAQRGGTSQQAATSAILTGVTQYTLARIPLNNLNKIANADSATTVRSVLQDYGKQFLTQSEMNVLSLYANNITDGILMRNRSAMNERISNLETQGMSRQDASNKAILEYYVIDPLKSVRDSAFQAAVFTGGGTMFKGINNTKTSPADSNFSPDTSNTNFGKPSEMPELPVGKISDVELLSKAYKTVRAKELEDAFQKTKSIDQNDIGGYNEDVKTTEGAGETVIDSVPKMRVGQWMSKTEYEQFLKTGEIPRTNVLTKGMDGYVKQANKGDFYVEFDIDPSLLAPKNEALGWSLIKPKNQMYIKLYQNKGLSWPEAIGYNISHVYTK